MSGSTAYQGRDYDLDCYVFGVDEAPLVAEVKSRRHGFKQLRAWLDDYDLLFQLADRQSPIVSMSWRAFTLLVARAKR